MDAVNLKDAERWVRTLSEPERAKELDGTDADFLARASARMLVEYDRLKAINPKKKTP